MTSTSYTLGARKTFPNISGAIAWKNLGVIGGVAAYARVEKTGEYVQVLETAPTEWVDGEPQAWSTGNFETVESAKNWASKAYRYLNKGAR